MGCFCCCFRLPENDANCVQYSHAQYSHAQYSHAQCSHAQYSYEHDMVYFVYNVLILMSRTVRTARNILDVVWRFGEIVVCLVCCFNTE